MARISTDPTLLPRPVRLARPLIRAFAASRRCPPEHRWHARSTLPVLALFVSMLHEHDSSGLPWERLDPDALVAASLDADPTELGFLRDLLDVSASFYAFLADERLVSPDLAARMRERLGRLALGMAA